MREVCGLLYQVAACTPVLPLRWLAGTPPYATLTRRAYDPTWRTKSSHK